MGKGCECLRALGLLSCYHSCLSCCIGFPGVLRTCAPTCRFVDLAFLRCLCVCGAGLCVCCCVAGVSVLGSLVLGLLCHPVCGPGFAPRVLPVGGGGGSPSSGPCGFGGGARGGPCPCFCALCFVLLLCVCVCTYIRTVEVDAVINSCHGFSTTHSFHTHALPYSVSASQALHM